MSDFDLDDMTAKVSGLHFAKEALSEHERGTLALAEQLLAEVRRQRDDVLALHPRNRAHWCESGHRGQFLYGPKKPENYRICPTVRALGVTE